MISIYKTLRFILTHPLASRSKFDALKRFFRYQFSKAFNTYPILYPFTDKSKLIIEYGMTGATGNIYCGLHEFEDMGFLLHFLRPEDCFIDVGANIGSYTILASAHVGCETISFEPIPKTFSKLQNNIAINYLQNRVIAKNIGIGSQKEVMRFTTNLDTINHVVSAEAHQSTVEIQVNTLDAEALNMRPAMIKIDVEGFEWEVIRGASNVLHNQELKAIIIELNGSGVRYGFRDQEIHEALLRIGFKPYLYNPFLRELKERAGFGDANTLYVRDLPFVKKRVETANRIHLIGEDF